MAGLMEGKVVLVTGGSSGIGKAAAQVFAVEGAQVIIASRGEEAGNTVVAAIQAQGGKAAWFAADVSQADSVARLFEQIQREYGRLDCAFNNAGSGGRV